MLFGYEQHLIDGHKSAETIDTYTKTINQFFAYMDNFYNKKIELHEIKPSDIKNFLHNKLEHSKNSISTLNKHLTILSSFFDFLWENNKIIIDPAAKIKRFKETKIEAKTLKYEFLLEIKDQVLSNGNYSNLRKAIFILALKGIRPSQYQFKKTCVTEKENEVLLSLRSHNIILQDNDAEYFMSAYYDSCFHSSNYMFITKKQDNSFVPIELMSIYTHLNAISKDYNLEKKLNLNDIRYSYVYYLHTHKSYSIENISENLGLGYDSSAQLLRNTMERYSLEEIVEI